MATVDDYVSITITRDQVGVTATGFGVPFFLGYSATWSDRVRYYSDLPSMVTDGFTTDSPEYLAANAAFAQSPRPKFVAVGRGTLKPTQVFVTGATDTTVGDNYAIAVAGKGVTSTTVSYMSLADLTCGAFNASTDACTITAHGMTNADGPYQLVNSGGALPAGLTAATNYWIIVVDANTIKFATSKANALSSTQVDITGTGTGTQTLDRHSNDVVIGQLVQGLNLVVGANYTAAATGSTSSKVITTTANAAGNWFSLAINDAALLSNKQTHVDPGVATDLTAIALASTTPWYGVYTMFNSQAVVAAVASWTEGNKRIYLPDVCETAAINTSGGTGGTSDTLDALHTSALTRTMGSYHPSPASMMGAAWLGKMLPKDPGSAAWYFKVLSTVPSVTLSTTQKQNLISRKGNSVELIAQLSLTFDGTCADGEFMDAIVGDDWVASDMQSRVFNVEVGSDKLEYEDSGIARVEAAVLGTLKEAVRRKIYAAKSISISAPSEVDVPDTDKQTRTLNNVKWSAKRSGGILRTNVQGTVVL